MGTQTFFRQRQARKFEHKPIYWDPRKEELDKRVARIHSEMRAAGELPPLDADKSGSATGNEASGGRADREYDPEELIRDAFRHSARHLERQSKRGITSSDRSGRIIKLMLALLALGFFFWFYFLR